MALKSTFTVERAAQLTGLSEYRLHSWAKTGVLVPSISNLADVPFGRVYSYRDLVGLRTLKLLRDEYGFSLQKLRQFGCWLHDHYGIVQPWSELRFYVVGDRLAFSDQERKALVALEPRGQLLVQEIRLDIKRVEHEVIQAVEAERQRNAADAGLLERARNVVQSQWVVKGTRIPTSTIWSYWAAGYTAAEIIDQFPELTEADITAAIELEASQRQLVAN